MHRNAKDTCDGGVRCVENKAMDKTCDRHRVLLAGLWHSLALVISCERPSTQGCNLLTTEIQVMKCLAP